jgi:hypothetical protein
MARVVEHLPSKCKAPEFKNFVIKKKKDNPVLLLSLTLFWPIFAYTSCRSSYFKGAICGPHNMILYGFYLYLTAASFNLLKMYVWGKGIQPK